MISHTPISIDECLSRVKIQLRLGSTTEHDDYLEIMISEGLRHLDALTLYVKRQCTLDIVDNRAELPKGFMKLLGMRFMNTQLINQMIDGEMVLAPIVTGSPVWYVDKKFLSDCGFTNSTSLLTNFQDTCQIVNNVIHFNSGNIESGTIQVAYMGLNTDEHGRLIIYEEYERALASYACWKFTQSHFNDYPANVRQDYQIEWVNQKAWIKGSAFKDEFQRTRMEVAAAANAMVSDKTVDWNI
jgi:hypothetical protein